MNLCKESKIKCVYIHRIVALNFIENPNNYKEINHKDENKSNNNVNNLEWCTRSYNCSYGNTNKNRNKSVIQYDKNNNFIKRWESIMQAARELEISRTSIVSTCKNKRKSAGGYIWKYE